VPGSFPVFDTVVEQFIAWISPRRALDIGCGSGKVGRMLGQHAPECERVGIEVEASYLERFALRDLYHRVDVADAGRWWQQHPGERFDLVVIGDCIEHLAKSQGLDLLNALQYRAAWVVVLAPEFIVQGAVGGVQAEAHCSVWSERDFGWHDLWAWDNVRAMSLFVLRGYLPSSLTMDRLVERVNESALPLHDFDGQTRVRPCRLRLVDTAREVGYRVR
jgi:SAM-dependent methyltransferase